MADALACFTVEEAQDASLGLPRIKVRQTFPTKVENVWQADEKTAGQRIWALVQARNILDEEKILVFWLLSKSSTMNVEELLLQLHTKYEKWQKI